MTANLERWAQSCLRVLGTAERLLEGARRCNYADVDRYEDSVHDWYVAWIRAVETARRAMPETWSAAGEIVT